MSDRFPIQIARGFLSYQYRPLASKSCQSIIGRMRQLILDLNQLAWPTKWATYFEQDGPLAVEIGFGNGQYLLELSQARPKSNIVGLELSLPSIRRAEIKLQRYQVRNVRLIHAEAKVALWLLCERGAIEEVVINYPDPWPKAAHQKRRVIQPDFLNLLATRMMMDGRLRIVTDHADYAAWIEQCLAESDYFESSHPTGYQETFNRTPGTKYAKKARTAGQHSYTFEWKRNHLPITEIYPVLEERLMPHAIIKTELSHHEIAERVDPDDVAGEELVVRLGKIYKSLDEPVVLVATYVAEKGYEQNVMLAIAQRSDGSYKIYVESVGFPRPTPAVVRSLKILTSAMLALDPSAELVSHNLGSIEPVDIG
jgi:tRNA (guanine-N7-)-methyltransferase